VPLSGLVAALPARRDFTVSVSLRVTGFAVCVSGVRAVSPRGGARMNVVPLSRMSRPTSGRWVSGAAVWRGHRGGRARLTSTRLLATSHANSSTAASSNTP